MKITRAFDFLYHQLENFPKADSLNYKYDGQWKSFTTEEVVNISREVGMGLIASGLQPGDKVAIVSPNRPEWNFIELAVQQAGLIGVPLYPTISSDDYSYILDHADVRMVFVGTQDIYDRVWAAAKDMTSIDLGIFSFDHLDTCEHWSTVQEKGKDGDAAELQRRSDAVKHEDLLTIIYTSGTTGRPKGVMLSHKNIVTNTIGVRKRVAVKDGNHKALSFLPLCHVYERTGIYVYFYTGTSIYYAESIEAIGDNLREIKPHTFNTVPRLLEKVYDKIIAKGNDLEGFKHKLFFWAVDLGLQYEPNEDQGFVYNLKMAIANKLIFSKWREALGGNIIYISSGAAALQPRLARVFWSAGIRVLQGYGLTETSPVITASHVEDDLARVSCVGPVIDGVEVSFAEDGEILCKGPNVMMGYYKDPEKTAEVMTGEWFHTGDIGVLVENKFLKITDRKKEMFKTSGGKYVAPQVIENVLKESFYIEQLAVIGESRKFPCALIVPNFEALEKWCKDESINYGSPQEIVKNPKVKALIDGEIAEANKRFGNWEQIKKYTLLPDQWTVESGEMTPTMKLKRRVINEKFASQIEAIYN